MTVSAHGWLAVEKRQRPLQLQRDAGIAQRVEHVGPARGRQRRGAPVPGGGEADRRLQQRRRGFPVPALLEQGFRRPREQRRARRVVRPGQVERPLVVPRGGAHVEADGAVAGDAEVLDRRSRDRRGESVVAHGPRELGGGREVPAEHVGEVAATAFPDLVAAASARTPRA